MQIHVLPTGDKVYRYEEAVVVMFNGQRKVISSGSFGGYREDLKSVFNHQSRYNYCNHPEDAPCTHEEYMKDLIENKLGLEQETTSGMATIVSMESVSIQEESYRDIAVTAIATASLEVNGGRVCDPASYYEEKGKENATKVGTINIMLHVNVNMTPACMARTIVTLTEAKTAAIQELLGSSLYSNGIATGSGSDTVIVTCNKESDHLLHYAGKHGKLGEMIGKTVKAAVKESLGKHMNLTTESQHSMEKRTFRFGVTQDSYWKAYQNHAKKDVVMNKADYIHGIQKLDGDNYMVVMTSLFIHLMDQLNWGLLSSQEVNEGVETLLAQIATKQNITYTYHKVTCKDDEKAMQGFLDQFVECVSLCGEKYGK